MPREVPVRARMIIEAALSERHYRARLPNGKLVVAHLERKACAALRSLVPGTAVTGELSPYDFDHARIAGFADSAGEAKIFGRIDEKAEMDPCISGPDMTTSH